VPLQFFFTVLNFVVTCGRQGQYIGDALIKFGDLLDESIKMVMVVDLLGVFYQKGSGWYIFSDGFPLTSSAPKVLGAMTGSAGLGTMAIGFTAAAKIGGNGTGTVCGDGRQFPEKGLALLGETGELVRHGGLLY